LQHWIEMSATCLLLSLMISLAVFVFSPKPADTSDRCATSDQCHSKSIKTEHEHADKQHSPRSNQVDVQPSRKRGGNRAASPVPALTKKHPDSSLLLPGGTFEARTPIQVTFSLSFLLCTVATLHSSDMSSSTSTADLPSSTPDFRSSFGGKSPMKSCATAASVLSM
jgi:hypothetical protein